MRVGKWQPLSLAGLKLKDTTTRDLRSCLMKEFSRVSGSVADEILKTAKLDELLENIGVWKP